MPVGYLVSVIVVAVSTLFALVAQRSLPNLSFRLGLLLNEVPMIGFYWLLIWTSLAFAQGDIDSPGGWATVGLAALTAAGLAVIARRELQARPALEQAMAEALGAGWRTAIDPGLATRLRPRASQRVRRRPGAAVSCRAARPAPTWRRWPPSPPTTPPSSPASRMWTPRSPPPSG